MDKAQVVKQFIVEELAPEVAIAELAADHDLLDSGIVDSLGLLTVLAWVEDRFGVVVDTAEIGEDDFRSVQAICALIDRAPQRAPACG